MIPGEPDAENGCLVDHVGVELDAAEPHSGGVEGRFGETDTGPTRDLFGANTQNRFGDQQVVGEIDLGGQASAGEPLENLAIPLHHGTQPLTKLVVASLTCDVLGDRVTHGVRDADPLGTRNRLKLFCLLG